MPVRSQAQRRFMYAVEEGKVPGVKKSVGKDFIEASHGIKHLPEHVKHEATSHGTPFRSKKGDGRPQTGGPRRKAKPDNGLNGMGAQQAHNADAYHGQGNTAFKGYTTSNP